MDIWIYAQDRTVSDMLARGVCTSARSRSNGALARHAEARELIDLLLYIFMNIQIARAESHRIVCVTIESTLIWTWSGTAARLFEKDIYLHPSIGGGLIYR